MTDHPTRWRWYRGHGLTFRAALDVPEFAPIPAPAEDVAGGAGRGAGRGAARDGAADVTIRLGPEAAAAHAARTADGLPGDAVATPAGPVLHLPDTADILVRDGREIVLSLAPRPDMGLVRLYLIGSAMGLLFHQRGNPVLHGAAILTGAGIAVFVGDSGAGKSTLAALLGRAGYPVLADDTLVLWPGAAGGFVAWPGSRVFKLWRDTLGALDPGGAGPGGAGPDGALGQGLETIAGRVDKFFVPNAATAPDRPVPLREVIALDRHDGPPRLTRMPGLAALKLIGDNVYRPHFVDLFGRRESHFQQISALSAAVACWQLHRPWDLARLPETVACLSAHWSRADRQAGGAGGAG